MKTPELIKKGLVICANDEGVCGVCPYYTGNLDCMGKLHHDAITCIQRLESTYSQVSKALCGNENETPDKILKSMDQLKSRLAQVELERDAAVADLEKYKGCGTCKFQDVQFECDDYQSCAECDNTDCPCYGISVDDCWQWRGVCEENTKEDG